MDTDRPGDRLIRILGRYLDAGPDLDVTVITLDGVPTAQVVRPDRA